MSWKVRSKLYHKLFTEHSDDLRKETIVEEYDKDSIVKRAVEYPVVQTATLYYPGKSYAVAIIFAYLLEKEFGEDFYKVLDDPDLLHGNDPYHVRYSEDKVTYDKIIEKFPFYVFDKQSKGSINFWKTYDYFYIEMLLDETTKMFAPPE